MSSTLKIAVGVMTLVCLALAVQALAQEGPIVIRPGGEGGAGAASRPAGGERPPWGDPEQMKKWMDGIRKQFSEQMRKDMGASEDEWKVLEPKVEKVVQLAGQSMMGGQRFRFGRGGGMGGWMGGGGPGGPGGPGANTAGENDKPTEVDTARSNLQKLVDAKDAKPEEVQKALTAYRDAKEKASKKSKEELEKARKDLREVLTQKQEAYLVLRGILD